MDPTAPPPGFVLDQPSAAAPPAPPPGFTLDTPVTADAQTARYAKSGTALKADRGSQESTWGDVGNAVAQLPHGFNVGVGSTVGRAADVIPYFADKAMGGEGVHPFENLISGAGSPPAPSTPAQEALFAGGNMAGQNIATLAPGAALAGAGVRSGMTAAENSGSIVSSLRAAFDDAMKYMVTKPGAALLGDTGSAALSGTGGEVQRQAAVNSGDSPLAQKLAEMTGQIATPAVVATYAKYAPSVLTAKVLKMGAAKLAQNIPEEAVPSFAKADSRPYAERQADQNAYANREGKYADPNVPPPEAPGWFTQQQDRGIAQRMQNAKDVVGKEFSQVVSQPEAAANLSEADRLQQEIPGFNPGVAKASGDPALLNLQKKIEADSTGNDLRAAQQRSDASTGAIQAYRDQQVPPVQGNKPPQDVAAGAVANRVNAVNNKIGAQQDAVKGQIQQLSDSLPEVDRIAAGGVMRDARAGAQQAADTKTNELRGQIAAPDTPIQVGENTMPLSAALDRRSAINQEMRDYTNATARSVDDVKNMRALQAERDTLDTAINANADKIGGLRAYADQYKNENVPQFRQGASAEVGRKDSFGYEGNRVDPENVGKKFFNPNEESAARQFNTAMGHDPAARQQMIDNALDDIRHTAIDPTTGQIKEGAVAKWLQKNERVLNEVPFVRDAVSAKNPDQLYSRLGDLEQRQRGVADTKVAGLLGKNPEQQIDAALNDWQVMRGLKASVRSDPQATAALQRAVWERAPDISDPAKLSSWIDGHRRTLAQVLTPQHLNALDNIAKAATIEARLPRPKGTTQQLGTLADKAADATGLSVQGYLSRALNVAKGYMSKEYAAADIATRIWHNTAGKEVDAAWREALSNPKVATDLSTISRNKSATPIQLKRLYNYMLTTGAVDAKGGPDRQ